MFNSRDLEADPGTFVSEDRCRTVEVAVAFRRIQCYRCDFKAVYEYRVQEVRRSPRLEEPDSEFPGLDELERWQGIPRYAAIPETVKCKRCGEDIQWSEMLIANERKGLCGRCW